jgi:Domain of Unknown Function with PDB structure (DUF3857)
MRCSSPALLGGFLTLCAFTGPARAQLSPQTYQSPITVLESHVTYTVAPDGTYAREETRRERINVPEAVQAAAQTYLPFNGSLERLEVLEAYTEHRTESRSRSNRTRSSRNRAQSARRHRPLVI